MFIEDHPTVHAAISNSNRRCCIRREGRAREDSPPSAAKPRSFRRSFTNRGPAERTTTARIILADIGEGSIFGGILESLHEFDRGDRFAFDQSVEV